MKPDNNISTILINPPSTVQILLHRFLKESLLHTISINSPLKYLEIKSKMKPYALIISTGVLATSSTSHAARIGSSRQQKNTVKSDGKLSGKPYTRDELESIVSFLSSSLRFPQISEFWRNRCIRILIYILFISRSKAMSAVTNSAKIFPANLMSGFSTSK